MLDRPPPPDPEASGPRRRPLTALARPGAAALVAVVAVAGALAAGGDERGPAVALGRRGEVDRTGVQPHPPAPPVPVSTTTAPPTPAPAPASTDPLAAAAGEPGSEPTINRPPPRPNRAGSGAPAPVGDPGGVPAPGERRAVFERDFPDPSVFRDGSTYWAVATQAHGARIPVARSADLRRWEHVGDALQGLPSWSEPGWVWAPSVLPRPPTGYVLYYTTRHSAWGLQCVSQAFSLLPQGPYLDTSEGPLICQTERGGSIDPEPFVDNDGTPWLVWKSEGTLQGEPTRIWSRRLSDDGRALIGPTHELLHTALPWEQPIIEGPHLTRVQGRYHLLYSASRWETAAYSVGHAVCASPRGPCHRTAAEPLVASDHLEAGPGAPGVISAPTGELVLTYHAWTRPRIGYPDGRRRLHLAALQIDGDRPTVHRPWRTPL